MLMVLAGLGRERGPLRTPLLFHLVMESHLLIFTSLLLTVGSQAQLGGGCWQDQQVLGWAFLPPASPTKMGDDEVWGEGVVSSCFLIPGAGCFGISHSFHPTLQL